MDQPPPDDVRTTEASVVLKKRDRQLEDRGDGRG